MVTIVNKTLVNNNSPFVFNLEPWMLKKSLSNHFFGQRLKKSFPGTENETVIVNARNPDQDVMRGNDLEIKSRSFSSYQTFIMKNSTTSLTLMIFFLTK